MSSELSNKCTKCEGKITLLPCPFCGQAVETRWNAMTGEHYIHHVDWNSSCSQRPFYGNEALWNERPIENALRAQVRQLEHDLHPPCNCPRCTGLPDYYADEATLDAAGGGE